MDRSGAVLIWEDPDTPATRNQLFSGHSTPTLATPHSHQPLRHSLPLSTSHFYAQIQFDSPQTPLRPFDYSAPQKRPFPSSLHDENLPPGSSPSPFPSAERPSKRHRNTSNTPVSVSGSSKRQSPRTNTQKLEVVLQSIQKQGWTLGGFLYNLFRAKDDQGNEIHRTQTHSQMVSIFLAGRANETVADIISEWMIHPDGRIPSSSPNDDLMFSTTVPYTEIRPVRAALTSFAVQTIRKKVFVEAEEAVKLKNGLHVSIGKTHPELRLSRDDIGEATMARVEAVIEAHQQVTQHLFEAIAMRKPRKRAGILLPREVITHAIATLNFCRTDKANLLPLMRGILYFGSSAPVELINYNCRIGNMPAPATIRRALITLSSDESKATEAHGADPDAAGFLFVDNTQNYHLVREACMGRESVMNSGMSGLYLEAPDVDVAVFNLEEKRALIAKNLRSEMTVDDLLGYLDQEDADLTGTLLFLDVLVRCITALKPLAGEIEMRLTATAKLTLPEGRAVVHPLACSGKKQTIPTELKDGMLDFLAQIGQTPEKYLRRKIPVGGDGLTYAMLQQLQTYLQFRTDDDPFKSFEILEPQLQLWHTKWTDVIRIFQTHWGRTTGKNTNPASLGFSAAKIGRAAPSNMKKVEFYPGTQLLYLVLDAKILDIWRLSFKTDDIFAYFEGLAKSKKLPDIETLLPIARKLYRAYGTARGRDHAIYDTGHTSEWAQTVPSGSRWVAQEIENSSLDATKRKKKTATSAAKKPRKPKEKPPPKPCLGDFVLAQNIDFIRDGLNSRKLTTAIARGDISRLYECYMLFTFGGSTHTNYLNYVLETIMNLELECSPGLKLALLRGLIWNLSGLPNHCEEGDYIVEFFNRLLEDVVQHKSAQFDDIFIRDIVSRNLRHIAQLKVAWRTGVGMEKKSRKHTDPSLRPEMLTLLKVYSDTELHSRRLTRQIDDRDTDDFNRGIRKLRDGALQTHIKKTTHNRQTTLSKPASETQRNRMKNVNIRTPSWIQTRRLK
ncbi:hypothetical protein R3P38DRAFT_2812341 [Favolaschia claudopus]|uniref:DUF6589 domain-containing protein n=1 Tax=Favolaschia claudopus TaxID=2862362 RepID=A0AAV9Z6Y8_9AGAR